jgi:hypothetical protein
MAKKKMSPKKITKKLARRPQQASAKKKPTKKTEAKKPFAKKKAIGAKKIAKKAIAPTKTASAETGKKPIAKPSPATKEIATAKPASRNPSGRQESSRYGVDEARPKGLGYRSAGLSGEVEGLSNVADADSESVEELIEEGQAFEAEVVSGVEDAPDPDEAEVTTGSCPSPGISKIWSAESPCF